jgi:hypothetical protein
MKPWCCSWQQILHHAFNIPESKFLWNCGAVPGNKSFAMPSSSSKQFLIKQQLCTHCQVFLKLLQRFLCSPLLWKIDLMWFFYSRQSVEKQIQKLELSVLLNCWTCRWSSITSEDKAVPLGTGSGMHCASIFLGTIFGSHTGSPPLFFPGDHNQQILLWMMPNFH